MRSFANWMIALFMIMYWGFRILVAYNAGMYNDFIVQPIDQTVEIVLLFVTLFCIVLVFKRKLVGGILYFFSYLAYFGADLFTTIAPMFKGETVVLGDYMTIFTSLLGIILAFVVLLDLAVDKGRKPTDKGTDWYYGNKDYDRKLDERADKNNYRTL